jgi:penicillin-binding protein 1B
MTNLLQSVVEEGTASRLRAMGLRGAIAGKTGTSSDGWFVGYTPNIVCAVWVGFDNNRDLRMKASDAALPMWADFMKQAVDVRPGLGGESFTSPGGIVTVEIDPRTGCLAGDESVERRQEIFIAGTQPFSSCFDETQSDAALVSAEGEQMPIDLSSSETTGHNESYDKVTVEVCALTGLLASSDCPRREKRTFELGKEPLEMCRPELHGAATSEHKEQTEPNRDREIRVETSNENRARLTPSGITNTVRGKTRYRKDGGMH